MIVVVLVSIEKLCNKSSQKLKKYKAQSKN